MGWHCILLIGFITLRAQGKAMLLCLCVRVSAKNIEKCFKQYH